MSSLANTSGQKHLDTRHLITSYLETMQDTDQGNYQKTLSGLLRQLSKVATNSKDSPLAENLPNIASFLLKMSECKAEKQKVFLKMFNALSVVFSEKH